MLHDNAYRQGIEDVVETFLRLLQLFVLFVYLFVELLYPILQHQIIVAEGIGGLDEFLESVPEQLCLC